MGGALWGLIYLAGFAVADETAFLLTCTVLMGSGLLTFASLQAFGLTDYFSGSVNYQLGTIGMAMVPLGWGIASRQPRSSVRALASIVAGVALFSVLASGSRGIYLALFIVVPFMVSRAWRAGRFDRAGYRVRGVNTIAIAVAVAAVLNVALPGNPVLDAIAARTGTSSAEASVNLGSATPAPAPVDGAVSTRLKMWLQAANVGVRHPLGTGANTFRQTIQGFQRFPTINFSSAHNVFVETFYTLGWPGLLVFLLLTGTIIVRGWRSDRAYPLALSAASLLLIMSFDVTWSMPAFGLLTFMALGASERSARPAPSSAGAPWSVTAVRAAVLLAGTVALVWWYAPCPNGSCAFSRHLGARSEAVSAVADAPDASRPAMLATLKRWYPRSVWAWTLAYTAAPNDEVRLAAIREAATRFPLASPNVYLAWAKLASASARPGEARHALQVGLRHFPPGLAPAGVPLRNTQRSYADWVSRAEAMVDAIDERQRPIGTQGR